MTLVQLAGSLPLHFHCAARQLEPCCRQRHGNYLWRNWLAIIMPANHRRAMPLWSAGTGNRGQACSHPDDGRMQREAA